MKLFKITTVVFFFLMSSIAAEPAKTTTGGSQSSWNNKGSQGSSNVYDSSKQGEKKNNLGMVVNGVGAAFAGTMAWKSWAAYNACAGSCANELMAATMFTMMTMQSLAQIAENSNKKGEYGGLANQFGCSDPKLCSTTPSPDLKPDPDGDFLKNIDFGNANLNAKKSDIKKSLAALKKAGVNIDFNGNKVTLPGGQSFDGSKLKSQADWDKMFGEAGKKALASANKSLADEIKKYTDGGLEDSSGGLASKSQSSATLGQGLEGLSTPTSSDSRPNQQLESSTDGLSKIFNGEPVGLSSDNIFTMISRRYKHKEEKREFLNENGDE